MDGRSGFKYLSVCSGIEAATAAWHSLGWTPAGFSEIDPFACAVLRHHYPNVPLHGDFTTIDADAHGTIDLLVGGTPCQSFSIAGLRKGLADDRGNLALEFIRLAKASRARWVVWENVPGVLSIDGGRAFGSFLGGLAECGYGFAYRILDAQYFGVPQRRRRVFVIGYLGDWRPAAAVLFERESLCGDITPRRETRERIADSLTVGANQCSGRPGDFVEDVAHALEASDGGVSGKEGRGLVAGTLKGGSGNRGWPDPSDGNGGGLIAAPVIPLKEPTSKSPAGAVKNGVCGNAGDPMFTLNASNQHGIAHTLRGDGFDASEDGTGRGTPLVAGTVSSKWAKGTGGPAGDECQNLVAFDCKASGRNGFSAGETSPTLRAMNHGDSHQNGGGQLAVAIPLQEIGKRTGVSADDPGVGMGIGGDGDAMYTLQAGAQHGIAFAQNSRDEVRMMGGDGDLAGALAAQPGMKQQTFVAFEPGSVAREAGPRKMTETCSTLRAEMGDNQPAVFGGMAVRRLTPRECERLQGFPDDYTLVSYRGKPAADGPRYKALGNSMAVPVMRWLGERIQKIEAIK